MTCNYIPQISAEFAKTITNEEIDREFQAIEEAFACFEEVVGSVISTEENIHDYGIIDNSYTLDPAFGIIQYMEIQGDADLELAEPEDGDPTLIALVIAGSGQDRFNFPLGLAWSPDRDEPASDSKPWNMFANTDGSQTGTQYEGFYGAVVNCIHDGVG